jgi:hypothetical protein
MTWMRWWNPCETIKLLNRLDPHSVQNSGENDGRGGKIVEEREEERKEEFQRATRKKWELLTEEQRYGVKLKR